MERNKQGIDFRGVSTSRDWTLYQFIGKTIAYLSAIFKALRKLKFIVLFKKLNLEQTFK